jgi:alpha-L-fucosidase
MKMIYTFFSLVLLSSSSTLMAAEQQPKFVNTVESLQQYECPDWFRDAKFGIYLHWGAYSVAEQGEWYARNLYIEGRPEYEHHLKTYGHPSEFGYADFIPMWKAENFDPDALLALFKRSGAKYFTPCAVHHDNFDLWNSKHHKWNAVNMGPKKDLIQMWKDATLKAGLRFGVTTHLSRSYSWLNTANQSDTEGPKKGVPYDGAQGRAKGLYPPNDGQSTHPRAPFDAPKEWRDFWARRVKQLIDDYQPDHLYFDCAVPFRGEDAGSTGMDVIAHFYNRRPEGVMCIKERPWQGLYADGMTTLDYERGKAASILAEPWQTDDSIGSWGYNPAKPYMTPGLVVDKIIDIVSKNGNMLLNIPIKADGTLDKEATDLLINVGEWFDVNGEAIYGTRPWYMYGDGKNEVGAHDLESSLTEKDFRYTTKGDTLYAFVMAWPKAKAKPVVLPNLTAMNTRINEIVSVELLGHDGELKWENHGDGLQVWFPKEKPCEHAYALKIGFKK